MLTFSGRLTYAFLGNHLPTRILLLKSSRAPSWRTYNHPASTRTSEITLLQLRINSVFGIKKLQPKTYLEYNASSLDSRLAPSVYPPFYTAILLPSKSPRRQINSPPTNKPITIRIPHPSPPQTPQLHLQHAAILQRCKAHSLPTLHAHRHGQSPDKSPTSHLKPPHLDHHGPRRLWQILGSKAPRHLSLPPIYRRR